MESSIETIHTEALSLPEQASAIIVKDNESYTAAAGYLKCIKLLGKSVKDHHDPIIASAHSTHSIACAARKKYLDPILQAEGIVKGEVNKYLLEQQRKEREEQARLARIAREEAEALALRMAADAEAAGEKEEAEDILNEVIEAPPVVVAPKMTPKVEGVSVKKIMRWRIKDASKIKPAFMMPNEKAISGLVKSMGKNAIHAVGEGIEVYEDIDTAIKA